MFVSDARRDMKNQWLATERYRLQCAENWPESSFKRATLAAARAQDWSWAPSGVTTERLLNNPALALARLLLANPFSRKSGIASKKLVSVTNSGWDSASAPVY